MHSSTVLVCLLMGVSMAAPLATSAFDSQLKARQSVALPPIGDFLKLLPVVGGGNSGIGNTVKGVTDGMGLPIPATGILAREAQGLDLSGEKLTNFVKAFEDTFEVTAGGDIGGGVRTAVEGVGKLLG